MIQVRVAQQSAVSVRIAGAASVRVDVTGTTVVGAPEYSGPYDITPLFSAQVLPTAKRLMQQNLTIKKDTSVRGIQRFQRLHTDYRRGVLQCPINT